VSALIFFHAAADHKISLNKKVQLTGLEYRLGATTIGSRNQLAGAPVNRR
jgi:hypothetical protein